MSQKKLVVTHHAPDLDAVGAVWVLTRFDQQHYADAQFAFVNPGSRITADQAKNLDFDLDQVTHVDTGLGKFDHHQPERAQQQICASTLTYEHVCQLHPNLKQDAALQAIVEYINEIDHFNYIHWSEASLNRFNFALQELIRGHELAKPNNDQPQLEYGLQSLDYAYKAMEDTIRAKQEIADQGRNFKVKSTAGLALKSSNDATIKEAQKMGYDLVIRKDPRKGHIRIKARPDSTLNLKALSEAISEVDNQGTWFFHPGGKMLLNGSSSHRDQISSPLTLKQVIQLAQKTYGK